MVFVFIDHADEQIKKSSLEALSYGAKLAEQLNTSAEGILLGTVRDDLAQLGNYGATKIHVVSQESLNQLDSQIHTRIIADAALALGAKVIIFANTVNGKAIAPRLSARLKAGL